MTGTVLSVAWAVLAAWLSGLAWSGVHRRSRRRAGAQVPALVAAGARGAVAAVALACGRSPPARPPGWAAPAAAGAGIAAAGIVAAPGHAAAAVLVGTLPVAAHLLAGRRRRARAVRVVDEALPEALDLLRLTVAAGLTVPLAVRVVARRGTGPVAAVLARATDTAARRRVRLAEALDLVAGELPDEEGAVAPLLAALADGARHGSPLTATLDRLAVEARSARRRRAEERARRVPVLLLLPLVTCILPAAVLLTVVPVAAGSLTTLGGNRVPPAPP